MSWYSPVLLNITDEQQYAAVSYFISSSDSDLISDLVNLLSIILALKANKMP